jgi:cytidyltransferase-like protein
MEKFDFGVYIGRFEPFHVAHLASVKFALERCETLIVVIGSCNKPRTTKNPWTAAERGAMILNSLTYEEQQRTGEAKGQVLLHGSLSAGHDGTRRDIVAGRNPEDKRAKRIRAGFLLWIRLLSLAATGNKRLFGDIEPETPS